MALSWGLKEKDSLGQLLAGCTFALFGSPDCRLAGCSGRFLPRGTEVALGESVVGTRV